MVTAIAQRVRDVQAGESQGMRQLQVMPILGRSHEVPVYHLLTPENVKKVKVTEVSAGGHVPVLKVHNGLDERVYLMDGQELVGAKQNRILNTDVMVPAGSTIEIPVSCVEQGRWHYRSRTFSPGGSASYQVRRGKSVRVHDSLKRKLGHDADQGAVWDEVGHLLDVSGASSPTGALEAAYETRQAELAALRADLELPDQAVGLAMFRGGQLLGIDLFDRHGTLAYFWQSLVDSYAIDCLHEAFDPEQPAHEQPQEAVAAALTHASEGDWEGFDPPGEGKDYRLDDPQFAGSALVWEEQVVIHLQLFPRPAQTEDDQADEAARFRPRVRRRYGGDTAQ